MKRNAPGPANLPFPFPPIGSIANSLKSKSLWALEKLRNATPKPQPVPRRLRNHANPVACAAQSIVDANQPHVRAAVECCIFVAALPALADQDEIRLPSTRQSSQLPR
jgi:hypothetical protein